MKKILLPLTLLLVTLFACTKDEESGPACAGISSLEITQNADILTINVSGEGALYYEISMVGQNSGQDDPDYGNIFSQENSQGTISVPYPDGYLFYARVVCGQGKKGDWFGPKPYTVQQYCGMPKDLTVNYFGFSWNSPYPYTSTGSVSNYQIEYGPQGFTHGQGITATVNGTQYNDLVLQGGQSYDFYVRAYCSNNIGYGNWAGPFTYYSENNINMCTPPSNITSHIDGYNGNNLTVHFEYNRNGEQNFQYTIVARNHDISEGTVHNLYWTSGWPAFNVSSSYDWDFYIRAVCSNGDYTQWVKKQFNP